MTCKQNTTIDIDAQIFKRSCQTASSPTRKYQRNLLQPDVVIESATTGTVKFDSKALKPQVIEILPALEVTDSDEDIKRNYYNRQTAVLVLKKLTGYAVSNHETY